MKPHHFLASSAFAIVLTSCAASNSNQYDTPAAPTSAVTAPASEPANPVYDTPAAYEESGTAAATPNALKPAVQRAAVTASKPTAPRPAVVAAKPSNNGSAIIHTVAAGDTLSGISAKYKIPAASIRQANSMTKDTVVLGRKMVIPSH